MLHNFDRELEILDRFETDYIRILSYDIPGLFQGSYKSYEYTRLCTILEGEKIISANGGDKLKYNSSQFLLMPPHSDIFMEIKQSTKAVVFELSDSLIKKVSENVSASYFCDYDMLLDDRLLCRGKSAEMKDILNRLTRAIADKKDAKFLLDLYAQELVYNLYQIKGIHQILNYEPDNPVNMAIQIMKKDYQSPITMKKLSSDLNMSEPNFCQYFKKVTGISPKEYLTKIKMEKAKEMVARESVAEASFDLGYENVSYFISKFKERYGITPKQYKIELLSQR